jgi:predicted nucleic acid-binding Zn ribbon protein
MKRVFTAPATVFKGSGFYRNDNRPKPKPEVTVTKDATVKKDSK